MTPKLDNVRLDQIRARADKAKRDTEEVFVIAGDDLRSRLFGIESDIADTIHIMADDIEAMAEEIETLQRYQVVRDEARDLLWCCKKCKKATTFADGAVMFCKECDETLAKAKAERDEALLACKWATEANTETGEKLTKAVCERNRLRCEKDEARWWARHLLRKRAPSWLRWLWGHG